MAAPGMTGCRERSQPFAVAAPCSAFSGQPCRYRLSNSVVRGMLHCLVPVVLFFLLLLSDVSPVSGSSETMKGPGVMQRRSVANNRIETSVPRIVLLGALTLFQKFISPVDGDRCGFSPSCSAFAREAVVRLGPVLGVQVTADRLMRCTFFKGPGPDYLLLPNGKLFDPLENNLLSSP
jgi:putative component of membrane protein insertase Oxa1/YidC/SpoIIIJ protein YidD